MRWIVNKAIELRLLIIVIAAALVVFGIVQIRNMPVDIYPEFNPPLVEVQTEALGLSAAEMEALITVPLEADLLNGIAWLEDIYSESVAGMSSILLVFEPGTDPIRARQMVQERLTQTFALPNVSSPPTMLQPLSTTSRVMMVGLSSEELSLIELGVLARWNIKPRLVGVPGVANVAIWGHRDRQLQVLVDPDRLKEHDVSLSQVIETTGESLWFSPLSYLESSTPGATGWIDTPNQRLTIQHELPISSAEDLAKVTLIDGDGLLLGDVADVVEDHQPLIGTAALNDSPGLILVIEKFPGANTLEVTQGVDEALEALALGLPGVEIDKTIFRPAEYVEAATSNLGLAFTIGAVLLLVVLALFFFDWRTTVVSFIVVPVSLITTVSILYWRGETFNMMVLAGLAVALGIIIDNAIVDVDNVKRRIRLNREAGIQKSFASSVFDSVLEMRSPLIFAMLMILLTILPLFFISGLAGSFFQPFVTTYVLAILISLLVALILTPALTMTLLDNSGVSVRKSPFRQRLQDAYNGVLDRSVGSSRLATIVAVVLIVAAIITVPLLQQDLIPSLKRTHLLIQWEAAPGTSRPEMNRISSLATNEIRGIPGVTNVGSHVGRAITGDAIVGINSGEIWVKLDPSADFDTTRDSIQSVIDGYPGIFNSVQTYRPERTAEALIGAEQDLVVRIYGHDLDVLDEKALEVRNSLVGIEGITEATADRQVEEPQVEIEVKLDVVEQYLIKPGEVRRQAATLLSGLRVGNLYEEQKVFDVVVWGVPEIRDSLDDINALQINTPVGLVPLENLADVRIAPSPIIIRRDVVSRYADVTINVAGRDAEAITADIQNILNSVTFPLEYHAEVLNPSIESGGSNLQRIYPIIGAVLVGILLLMQASFRSWKLALAALLTLPVALSGGLIAALLTGGVLSLGSLFGLLGVLGIAISNAVILFNRYRTLNQFENVAFGPELIRRGARERLGPVLMTALATIAFLLPIIFAGDIAGYEMIRPIAFVLLGGLITTAVLNLFILPSLYMRYGAQLEPEMAESSATFAHSVGAD